jgi:Na+:H+ antiporter, NhaA family
MATRDSTLAPARYLIRPFQRFFELEASSGLLLLAFAVTALVWANSPFADSYFRLWQTPVSVEVGAFVIAKPLLLWINDGLMAVFFFLVGLEIKREVTIGELSAPKNATLAVAAALGGMLVPAAIYAALNTGGPGAAGWGIPMATDIAFALGVLALLGSRVPPALKVFVTAVAIVDDLGAVLVIALFYTAQLSLPALAVAGGLLAVLAVSNLAGMRRTWPYAVLGLALWIAVLKSGLHATVAGVLLAFTIPARRVIDATAFATRADALLAAFRADLKPGVADPTDEQRNALHSLEVASEGLETPLQRLEHGLHPWVAFVIMPVFALANAGVAIGEGAGAMLMSPISLGIILGLVLGKQLGVLGFSWAAIRLGFAALPEGVGWMRLWGVSLLCGIGFTMSLFIASLALADAPRLDTAKIGVLAGSLISGAAGAWVLLRAGGPRQRGTRA